MKYCGLDENPLRWECNFRCQAVISHYGFNLKPLSEEEKNFPIAYGILTYKRIDQVLFLTLIIHNFFLSPTISSSSSFSKCGLDLLKSACALNHVPPFDPNALLVEVFYMMSSIYHPQNAYCIGIDNKTNSDFKKGVQLLQSCLPNVHVMVSSLMIATAFADCATNCEVGECSF